MPPPLIIGGGPAGSAVAIALARAGAAPLLLEKSHVVGDAICGGFLSWQSLSALERLGIGAEALAGHRVNRVRLFAGRARAQAHLPQPGMGLSRRRLDQLLIDAAMDAGAEVRRGCTVRSIRDGAAHLRDGSSIASPAIFLATGKYALPGEERVPPRRVAADPVLGLRIRLAPAPQRTRLIDDAVELFLFDRGYAGLVLQEDGSANLCLAVHKSRLAAAGGRPEALLAQWADAQPHLGERMTEGWAQEAWNTAPIDAIGAIPYGWMARGGTPGLWRLGDQAAVIPSLAGEGMGIALATAASAAQAWQASISAEQWQRAMNRRIAPPMRLARLLWRGAESPRINAMAVRALSAMPGIIGLLGRATRVRG